MIAIRLLLLTLSLYGLSRLAMRRLRLPVEGGAAPDDGIRRDAHHACGHAQPAA